MTKTAIPIDPRCMNPPTYCMKPHQQQRDRPASAGRSPSMILVVLLQFVNHKTRTEFGLEPGGFRRHDGTGVSYVHQLLH